MLMLYVSLALVKMRLQPTNNNKYFRYLHSQNVAVVVERNIHSRTHIHLNIYFLSEKLIRKK